ncbi:flavin reductase family protein [Cohnella endophytica]|uniref:Flavin reductase family protein n=1 Tax=Cohnella endophytica TaxID=2419778 RepID=A0A494XM40_9BACL|nr:flavin reductase family protein [Cohnella endophytica]RKP51678.1 flavin reductase family protein [Cohnella endophytica]
MKPIDPNVLSERDNYKLLTGSIIPRPVAFVTTLSSEGVLNAAPFSYFNIVTANPPMISVSVQRKSGGERKDTSRNAIDTGAFVVHVSDEDYVDRINVTAANLPSGESEVELAGLTPIGSDKIPVAGIAEAKIRMECVLEQAIPLGGTQEAPACDLLIGRVVMFHVAEALHEGGRIDPLALKPVSRLAGSSYAKLGELFSIERPL